MAGQWPLIRSAPLWLSAPEKPIPYDDRVPSKSATEYTRKTARCADGYRIIAGSIRVSSGSMSL